MKKLKMGDKVQVFFNDTWDNERIYIKDGKDSGIICVDRVYNKKYKIGESFITVFWKKDEWRHIEEKTLVPFEWEDRDILWDKKIKDKDGTTETKIDYFRIGTSDWIGLSNGNAIAPYFLLKDYVFINEKGEEIGPCGKEV